MYLQLGWPVAFTCKSRQMESYCVLQATRAAAEFWQSDTCSTVRRDQFDKTVLPKKAFHFSCASWHFSQTQHGNLENQIMLCLIRKKCQNQCHEPCCLTMLSPANRVYSACVLPVCLSGSIVVDGHELHEEDLRLMYTFDQSSGSSTQYEAHSDAQVLAPWQPLSYQLGLLCYT